MSQSFRQLCLVWAGIVIGVSLLATPAKFLAPDLSMPHALQVGRVTFRVLAASEVAMLAFGLALVVLKGAAGLRRFLPLATLAALLLIQYAGILPLLGGETDQVIAGQSQPSTSLLHTAYIVVELTKIGLLLALGLSRGGGPPRQ